MKMKRYTREESGGNRKQREKGKAEQMENLCKEDFDFQWAVK